MLNYRKTACTFLIGQLGTGKTSLEEELIKMWIKDHPDGLIYGFINDPNSRLSKYITNWIPKNDYFWATKLQGITNSLFVLDDYVGLMKSDNGKQMYIPTPGMSDFFQSRRYLGNEIIASCHGPRAIIPDIAQYITHYVIFKTSVDEGKFDSRMQGGIKLRKAAKMVNAYCKMIGGTGYHPSDPKYTGQGFPYIELDAITWVATPVNMKRELFKQFIVKD